MLHPMKLQLSPRAGPALTASLVRLPPDRRRLGSVVRTTADGPRARQHHLPLYLRVERLPHSHLAASVGCDRERRSQYGRGNLVKRIVDYTWRLPELMAAHGMHNSTDLSPPARTRNLPLPPSGLPSRRATTRTCLAADDGGALRHLRLRNGGPGHRHGS